MSRETPEMPEGPGRSNYDYGREWEIWTAKYFLARYGGEYDLSPGSRGAADIVNYTPKLIICTQCKASRPDSDAHPSVSNDEKIRLQKRAAGLARARGKPAVAILMRVKGRKVKFEQLAMFKPSKNVKKRQH